MPDETVWLVRDVRGIAPEADRASLLPGGERAYVRIKAESGMHALAVYELRAVTLELAKLTEAPDA